MKAFTLILLLITMLLVLNSSVAFGQYTWTKYAGNPVLTGGGNNTWDKHVFMGHTLFNADANRYEMFYCASYGPESGWRPYRTGLAYSTDKINWTKYSGNPILTPDSGTWDEGTTEGASVIRENGQYKMWYTGGPENALKIGYATSPDGMNWTKHPGNPVIIPGSDPWESGGVAYPMVLAVAGGYIMWYTGFSSNDVGKIGRATSTDGINWQKDTVHNPVVSPEPDIMGIYSGSVVKSGNKHYMYYTGYTGSSRHARLAISSDEGITWERYSSNPILTTGSSASWDSDYIEAGSVLFLEDSVFYMWYAGSSSSSGTYLWKIGMATSPLVPPPLSVGTYSVGNGGYFSTIDSVFKILNTNGISGPVTIELTDNLYTAPTDLLGFKLEGPISGTGPNGRITIKPATNKNVTIEGSGRNVITFLNTNYVNIDGVSTTGSTTLTIHAIQNSQFDQNNCLSILDNSDNNSIKNLIIIADDYQRGSRGLFISSRTNPQYAPDNNLVEFNFIKKAGVAILIDSYSSTVKSSSNIIRKNDIGSETDSLISWGIQSQGTMGTIIDSNHVQNIRYSIHYESPGIDSYCDNGCKIFNNVVHNIDSRNARDGGFGIEVSGDIGNASNNTWVYNNMVYDIRSSSNRVAGIQLWYTNNTKLYYNSVNLSGKGGGNSNGSAALYISHSSTNVTAKNNIFVNRRDESPYCASSIYDYTIENLTSDFNDLFYEVSQYNCLARIGGSDYHTLPEWQATGKDLQSVTEMPNFIAPYLHIDENIATYLESRGTRILGLGYDFDGDLRNTTTPDIGADEFDGVVGVENETTPPTEFALMQNYPNPFNPSTKISWQSPVSSWQTLKVYDVLGNEVATLVNEEKPAGSYEINWNASQLSSGVYFYQLKAGDFTSVKKMILLK